jgi:hypothetical protein
MMNKIGIWTHGWDVDANVAEMGFEVMEVNVGSVEREGIGRGFGGDETRYAFLGDHGVSVRKNCYPDFACISFCVAI